MKRKGPQGSAKRGSDGGRLLRKKRGLVALELPAEMQVGWPEAHRYRGKGIIVPDERAQARNLGGTAKQPFALNEGERLFLSD